MVRLDVRFRRIACFNVAVSIALGGPAGSAAVFAGIVLIEGKLSLVWHVLSW